ncbi:hypothetical protein SAMN05216337_101116 [Bradyrhizobium brasilense]|uniref:Uncharacterized protein n=2 Tax=Bradyrhizobium brasilense TaxID=1419277 RepID=A0A1G6UJJ4_9BRAD|nr:hypothetical protein SAMN05216337_101116 [Bradyrhizobium brasilense]
MGGKMDRNLVILNVTGSETMLRSDGHAAIRLETKEMGPVAFEVSLQAIAALRRHLARAEIHILQSQNQTKN